VNEIRFERQQLWSGLRKAHHGAENGALQPVCGRRTFSFINARFIAVISSLILLLEESDGDRNAAAPLESSS
jgi:hypothetical protein